MGKFSQAHQSDDEAPNTIVIGSKDIRPQFRDGFEVRGGFYLQHVFFYNFQAGSPGQVIDKLNERETETGIHASINSSGHLVLANSSNGPITFEYALPFQPMNPAVLYPEGHPERARLESMIAENGGRFPNSILEDLGLSDGPAIDPDAPLHRGPAAIRREQLERP